MENYPSKTLKIGNNLVVVQEKQLLYVLKRHALTFSLDYNDMKGIHPNICTHCTYIKYDSSPIRKPQRRMDPTLKDIVNGEL
jgi:hypothetical protein